MPKVLKSSACGLEQDSKSHPGHYSQRNNYTIQDQYEDRRTFTVPMLSYNNTKRPLKT